MSKLVRLREMGVQVHACTTDIDLIALRDAKPDETTGLVTTEHRIFPDGQLFHPSNPETPWSLDDAFRKGIIASQVKSGLGIQVDFNHLSAGGWFSYPSIADGAAAGWVTELEDRGAEGLWGKFEWTDAGLTAIRARQYRYLSPEFTFKQFDKASGEYVGSPRLYAVALTNRPFLEQQDPIAATDRLAGEEITMPTEKLDDAALKLAETQKKLEESNTRLAELEAAQKVQDLAMAGVRASQRASAIDEAVKAGRVTPAMLEGVNALAEACGDNIDKLKKYLANLPVQTRPKPIGEDPKVETGDKVTALSDDDRAVAKFLGLTEAQFRQGSLWAEIDVHGKRYDSSGNEIVKGVA